MHTLVDRQVAVLDWLDGHLVLAQGGHRANYRPLSETYPSLAGLLPIDLVQALNQRWGVHQFYLADLNLLQGGQDTGAMALALAILEQGFTLWFDRGDVPSDASHIELGRRFGPRFRPVLGTESCSSPQELFQRLDLDPRVTWTVSLDLWGAGENWRWFGHSTAEIGRAEPRGDSNTGTWSDWSCLDLVAELAKRRVQELIILNLADVGAARTTTAPVLQAVHRGFRALRILAGGGVRSLPAMAALLDSGADRVLVGSWLWAQLAAMKQSSSQAALGVRDAP